MKLLKVILKAVILGVILFVFLSPAFAQGGLVEIEFIQWWEPELPAGSLRAIVDGFEAQNPGIKVKLISGPYSAIFDQIVTGAATGTLSDVVGLDGTWVNDLAKQDAIASLDGLIASTNYDTSQVAEIIKLDNKSYMFPVASFIYPLFINLDLFKAAGIEKFPTNRSEFIAAARKLTNPTKNQYGWAFALSLESPYSIKDDIMSQVWASGKSMMKDGRPDLTNSDVVSTLKFIDDMYQEGLISPGSFAKREQDKVEEFVNGRIGMMIGTPAHINIIRDRNPSLNFTISDLPVADGYTGPEGLQYDAWGIGISEVSKHKEEAWKLVTYLMNPEVNSKLVSIANAFPGNVHATPDFLSSDELLGKCFEMFQSKYLVNEFVGLPVAEELMRILMIEVQLMLDGKQTAEQAVAKAQAKWETEF